MRRVITDAYFVSNLRFCGKFRACLKTLKKADFAEFSFQARKFTTAVPGHVKGN